MKEEPYFTNQDVFEEKLPCPMSITFWIDEVFYSATFQKKVWYKWFGWKSDTTFICPFKGKKVHAFAQKGTLLPLFLFTIKFKKEEKQ